MGGRGGRGGVGEGCENGELYQTLRMGNNSYHPLLEVTFEVRKREREEERQEREREERREGEGERGRGGRERGEERGVRMANSIKH